MTMNNKVKTLTAAIMLALSTFATTIHASQANGVRAESDRTWYLAGEPMTVSVTANDALIAYAELCDMYGLAAGIMIELKEGKGTGVIELPSNLHSGYYLLSAYTRNDARVAQQLVAVVNTLHKSEDDDIEWIEIPEAPLSYPEGDTNVRLQGNEAPLGAVGGTIEVEGHIIKARVTNVYNGTTFRSKEIYPSLSIVGKQLHYFEGKMENDTLAIFYTYGIHGRQPLVLSAVTDTGVSLPIEIISPFAALLPKELPHLVFHYRRSEVEARSMEMQRHQIAIAPAKRELQLDDYADETAEEAVPLDYDETLFGAKPDLSYNLDEYRQFRTIREVLLEYVECVRKIKRNGVPRLIVRRKQDHYYSSWPAMVFIDGMPVNDTERLLDYDARRIHYINIYGGQYTFGNSIYNGVLSLISRSGRLTNYPTETNVQYLVYDFPEAALPVVRQR
jgi:hypothetical protein